VRIPLAWERRGTPATSEDIYVYPSVSSNVPATHLERVLPPSSSSTVVNSKFEDLQPLQKAKTSLLFLAALLTVQSLRSCLSLLSKVFCSQQSGGLNGCIVQMCVPPNVNVLLPTQCCLAPGHQAKGAQSSSPTLTPLSRAPFSCPSYSFALGHR